MKRNFKCSASNGNDVRSGSVSGFSNGNDARGGSNVRLDFAFVLDCRGKRARTQVHPTIKNCTPCRPLFRATRRVQLRSAMSLVPGETAFVITDPPCTVSMTRSAALPRFYSACSAHALWVRLTSDISMLKLTNCERVSATFEPICADA